MKTLSKAMIAVVSGSLLGCGYLQPAAETGNQSSNQLSRCEQMATVDDFEDANTQILVREGRGEYLYTYADGLGTEIEFPSGDFRAYPGGVGGSKFVARMRGTTAKSGGDIYAGLGFGLSAAGPDAPYDASKYAGVSFLAKRGATDAAPSVLFNVADVNTDPKGNICKECFNHFGATIKLTDQWTRYVIFFDEMQQRAGWGDPRPANVDPSALLGMSWQVMIPNAKFDVMIDDIRFVGACGEEFPGREKKDEAAPAPAPEPPAPEEPIKEVGPDDERPADTAVEAQ